MERLNQLDRELYEWRRLDRTPDFIFLEPVVFNGIRMELQKSSASMLTRYDGVDHYQGIPVLQCAGLGRDFIVVAERGTFS